MERWSGRVAMVTGAGGGIGGAIARALAKHDMRVVAVDRRLDSLQALDQEFTQVVVRQCDVTKEEEVTQLVMWIRETLNSGPDVLVNSVGVANNMHISELNVKLCRRLYDVNVISMLLCTHEVLADMHKRNIDDGHIFNINSILGQRTADIPKSYLYQSSKQAITVLTEGLRRELRDLKTKIRVTSISPGLVYTEMPVNDGRLSKEQNFEFFAGRTYLQPEDIAEGLIYALSTPPHVQVHELTILPTGEGN